MLDPVLKPSSLLLAASFVAVMTALLAACTATPERASKPMPVAPLPGRVEHSPRLGPPLALKNDPAVQIFATDFNELPGWHQDDHAAAFQSFQRSCTGWRTQPDERALGGIFELGRVGDWKKLCGIGVANGQEKQFFERWFRPYAVASSGSFDGLFTGYFVPQLRGSLRPGPRFRVPVYGLPNDLVKRNGQSGRLVNGQLLPYYQRADIVAGALAGKGLELLWVDSDIDAFFMEIQGSGQVLMDDGSIRHLSFAGKNGHGYYAIGKTLVDRGEITRENLSMQTIRDWIIRHPQEGRDLMLLNPSYVFFKFGDARTIDGPIGSMNVPLTAGYSLAVDKHYLPLGVPLWLDAEHPASQRRLQRLVMAQDTGGAIKGVIRGDVFWGTGEQAGDLAGGMKSRGRYFLLVPRHIVAG